MTVPPQPLLGVGPDGLKWQRDGRGTDLAAVLVIVLVCAVVAIVAAALAAPLVALGAVTFAAYRLIVLIGSLPAALTPWIIQVGPDGVWLPELGYRRWTEFSSIRVETYQASPRALRRLGFELWPDAERGRSRLTELEADIRLTWYRVASSLGGVNRHRPARYALREAHVGTTTFDAILAAVGGEVPLVEDEPVQGPEPDDLVALHEIAKDRRKRWLGWGVFALFLAIVLGMVVFSKPIPVIVPVEATPAPAVSPSGS